MSARYLFAHVSWMPRYVGTPDDWIFSTHGYVVANKTGHERWNFRPENGRFLGYVPLRGKGDGETPGEILIEQLGASRRDSTIDGITVIWFANAPRSPKDAYIVGWYRNATVFREAQFRGKREFRMSCRIEDATLLDESDRTFSIPHVRSRASQALGYGYGQSSVWYARNAPNIFLEDVTRYIDAIDRLTERGPDRKVVQVMDAINDLDDAGREPPEKRQGMSSFYVRDPEVRRQVVERANGRCEYCDALGFKRSDGSHFVEAHHIIHLSKQGPDTLDNVIALCPNHHREAHFGADGEAFEAKLKAKLRTIRGN